MMNLCRFIFIFGIALQGLNSAAYAQADREESLKPIIQEVAAKLEKTASRRPFRFKGMNDSLQWTLEAIHLFDSSETPKTAVPLPVWSSGGPLSPVLPTAGLNESQKKILDLIDKACAAHPKNSFALAVKAEVLNHAGKDALSSEAWQVYLSHSQDYSSFDREILSRGQFDSVQDYAKNFLRLRGVDSQKLENERLERLPFYKKIWYVMTHVAPEERKLNRLFMISIMVGSFLLVMCSFARMDFYRAFVLSLAALYAAVCLSYGCWTYDRAYGLPWKLSWDKTVFFIFGLAFVISVYELATAWRYANPRLEEGYRRCPHCKKIVVQLSVECEFCHEPIA